MEQLALPVHDSRERLDVEFAGDRLDRLLLAGWDAVEVTPHGVRRAPRRRKPFDARTHDTEFWRRHPIEAPTPVLATRMPSQDPIRAADDAACDAERVDRTLRVSAPTRQYMRVASYVACASASGDHARLITKITVGSVIAGIGSGGCTIAI